MNVLREFKSQNLEIWKIEDLNENVAFLVIIDEMRESKLSDYPWLPQNDSDHFEARSNFINVKYISTSIGIKESDIEEIRELVESLLNHIAQAYCDWTLDLIEVDTTTLSLEDYVNNTFQLKNYNDKSYRFLSQDNK